ncbi:MULTISPECIES: sugar phosphate isomerase/epimerase family protein [Metabacillus]|uniref:Sugar phosphate isomerase n=2 Tax=Metabacillus TaxID=2675233 RepID=A0A179SPU9_9BACI|nr:MULTISPECIES: sugar phosphate isomerase/epimerase family protein [Metabacillus]OAS82949.1 sugar phosphate isomerase [Metabacillus litoralis]QNF27506.1 sugar phosphate isomerase/epimerase [Metabacillus sp. KUDC1714]
MKLGMSSYSLVGAINSGEMSIMDVIQWTADQGGEHIELVPMGFSLTDNPWLIEEILQKTEEAGIEISNYAIGADFLKGDREAFEQEIVRVKKEVDIAHQLGVKLMRHDVAFKSPHEASIKQFELDLPRLTEACQRIADYAAQYDIVTSVENHGFYVQASERIQRLIESVARANFKTTLDTGNFLCVDEDPVAAVKKNIAYASMVHTKDFYYRPASSYHPGEGWFQTASGNYLRGAITGHGDIHLYDVLNVIKQSGYDGYISIEFEGLEECRQGSKIGLDNVKRIWEEL